MTSVALLLPVSARRRAPVALAGTIAAALAMVAAAPLVQDRRSTAWVLAQAIGRDAATRRRTADQALRLLRAEPTVAAVHRRSRAEMLADLREVTGTAPSQDVALPELVEARLVPGADLRGVQAALRRVPGVEVATQPGEPPLRPAARAACFLLLGGAAAAVALAAILDAAARRRAIDVLHRLGATPGRIAAEAALPAIAASALGIAIGTALWALLPRSNIAAAPLPAVPLGLLLIAGMAACGSLPRRPRTLA